MTFYEALGKVMAAYYLRQPIPEEETAAVLAALPPPWRLTEGRGELCLGCIVTKVKLGQIT